MKILMSEKLSPHRYKDNHGYLICTDCIMARTGKQTYTRDECFGDGDQTEIEVDRREKDVFDPKTLASFENVPITIEHPDGNVDPENYSQLSVGYMRDIHKGSYEGKPVMVGTAVLTDSEGIEKVESGELTNLSCGYDCDVDDTENPHQSNIRGNHIALCEVPRAGITRIQDSLKKRRNNMRTRDKKTFTPNEINRIVERTEEEVCPDSYQEDDDFLDDGIVKTSKGWTNKGREGTHGMFNTKKGARQQQKAMFARGWKRDTEEDENVCVICGKHYEGYGNNAQPVADGRCCDECNIRVVIPARLKEISKKKNDSCASERDCGTEEYIVEADSYRDALDIVKNMRDSDYTLSKEGNRYSFKNREGKTVYQTSDRNRATRNFENLSEDRPIEDDNEDILNKKLTDIDTEMHDFPNEHTELDDIEKFLRKYLRKEYSLTSSEIDTVLERFEDDVSANLDVSVEEAIETEIDLL